MMLSKCELSLSLARVLKQAPTYKLRAQEVSAASVQCSTTSTQPLKRVRHLHVLLREDSLRKGKSESKMENSVNNMLLPVEKQKLKNGHFFAYLFMFLF